MSPRIYTDGRTKIYYAEVDGMPVFSWYDDDGGMHWGLIVRECTPETCGHAS